MNLESYLDGLDWKALSVQYADVRVESTEQTLIRFLQDELVELSQVPSVGAFLRVFHGGRWFYKATTRMADLSSELIQLAAQARSAPALPSSTGFQPPAETSAVRLIESEGTSFAKMPMERKREVVAGYVKVLRDHPLIKDARAVYRDMYKVKAFAASTGRRFAFDHNQGGITLLYTLGDGQNIWTDFYKIYADRPEALNGHESGLRADMKESERFLSARSAEPGKYDLVMSSEFVGVFTHESFGHKSEADALLGDPDALKEWQIGKTVAAECVSIVDSGLHKNTSGYCPIDDDGVTARKNYLIKDGRLAGRLHSAYTATAFAEPLTGNSRAIDFTFQPIVRMTSTYIEPGSATREELFERVRKGIFVQGYRYGTGLSTFTIAPIKAYWIENGRITEPVRVGVVSGSVFETMSRIEAVADDFELHSSALGGCGKDEQMPLPVSHGGPSVLVRDMQVS